MKKNLSINWISSIVRWFFGVLFIGGGVYYRQEGAWPLIVFGAAFFITGFLRPKRCVDQHCEI